MKNSIFKSAVLLISLGGAQLASANEELFINRIYEAAARFANQTPNCSEQLKQVASMANKDYATKRDFYNNINKETKKEIGIGLASVFVDTNNQDSVRVCIDTIKYMTTTGAQLENHYKVIIMELDKIKNEKFSKFASKAFEIRALINKIPKKEKEKTIQELRRFGISEAVALKTLATKLGK